MTASTRFLGFAVLAWAGVRAIGMGLVPGSGATTAGPAPSQLSAFTPSAGSLVTTEFAPFDAVSQPAEPVDDDFRQSGYADDYYADAPYTQRRPATRGRRVRYRAPPEYVYGYAPRQSRARVRYVSDRRESSSMDDLMPEPRRVPFRGDPTSPHEAPAQLASASQASWSQNAAPPADPSAPPRTRRSNRLELSTWALMRGKPGDILGPNSLSANGATLGGSQAGARLSYWVTPHLAGSLRLSSAIGGARGGEAGLGVRFRPWLSVPFAVTAERRQRFGQAGGRNDFALFAEGGLWDRPMPFDFRLNAYAQAGVVGIKSRDLFGDGAFTLTRPIWRNIWAGFGVWGGAQPGLYRIDAGPRLSIRMKHGISVHADYRQRLYGTAFPSSGPAVTIAGDF